jgi:hypothetical protein
MWERQRLTTLWAFTACYRDSFTFTFTAWAANYLTIFISLFNDVVSTAKVIQPGINKCWLTSPVRQKFYSPDISSPQYWCVLSAPLDENEIMRFSDSPYCVALTPHTSIGLLYLQVWDFKMFFCSKAHLNCGWFSNFSFSKIGVDRHGWPQ